MSRRFTYIYDTYCGWCRGAHPVIAALIESGVPEIRLTNRTRARSEALRHEFGAKIHVHDWVQAANAARATSRAIALFMNTVPSFLL